MRTIRTSRLLAPLALVVCALAVAFVASSSLGGEDEPTPAASTAGTQSGTTSTSTKTSTTSRKTYVVKSGDSLSLIAEKTGVGVEELVRLNPGVDPQSLRTGQKLKLKES